MKRKTTKPRTRAASRWRQPAWIRATFLAGLLQMGLGAAPVTAQSLICAELWFTRNLIFDREGFCFSTPLGQAVFDNSDCRGAVSTLPPQLAEIVARLRGQEAALGCAINTDARVLSGLAQFQHLRAYDTLPIPATTETSCRGFKGRPVPLLAAPVAGAREMGELTEGDDFYDRHQDLAGWSFATVVPHDGPPVFGWHRPIARPICAGEQD